MASKRAGPYREAGELTLHGNLLSAAGFARSEIPVARWWRRPVARLATVLSLAATVGYPLDLLVNNGAFGVTERAVGLGLAGLGAFSLAERRPRRLPASVARWVLQVLAVGVVMIPANVILTILEAPEGSRPFWTSTERQGEFGVSLGLALLIAPWTALAALIRQKDALARHQATAFALQRTNLERAALHARLQLMQAQVTPHFLFNTLANVQALVEIGSPRASAMLDSLIAYLRAAVPSLGDTMSTLDEEMRLTQAYLELMHMRMPDRLQFALDADPACRALRCPPMTVLTLVENAVKHGIDPSEIGGRIDVQVRRTGVSCRIRVADNGVGLRQAAAGGTGTGLATLRQRLLLAFGDATLNVAARHPRGVVVELAFPIDAGLQQ